MPLVNIPSWNARGVIPPVNMLVATSAERSPYKVSLLEVIQEFGTTPERRCILDGFLRYRAALHAVGMMSGFQWLDGSFFENIELIEARPPSDMDVVSFFMLAPGQTQLTMLTMNPTLFPTDEVGHKAVKVAYMVDGFMQGLQAAPHRLVSSATYWYSMWSHRRDLSWKGYVEVDMSPEHDGDAIAALAALSVVNAAEEVV